jgi:hypothetical protein
VADRVEGIERYGWAITGQQWKGGVKRMGDNRIATEFTNRKDGR